MRKILFAGMGTISKGLIANLLKKSDYDIIVITRNETPEAPCARVKYYNSLDDCLKYKIEIIISCVPDDTASRQFWYNKLLVKYIRNNKTICIEMSTLSYAYIKQWFLYITNIGGEAVESPLTGSKTGAESGTLSLFVYTECTNIYPFFEFFSKTTYSFSKAGEPTKFKLFYNMWGAAILYQLAEMFPIFLEQFKDQETVQKILSVDGWMSPVCTGILPRLIDQSFNKANFKYKYILKDMKYAFDVFGCYDLPITKRIYKAYKMKSNKLVDDLDFSYIASNDHMRLYPLREKIKSVAYNNGFYCLIYLAGSFGRREMRYRGGKCKSDIDILIVCKKEDLHQIKRCMINVHNEVSEYYSHLSFVFCLPEKFISNVNSNFYLSLDLKNPIFENLCLKSMILNNNIPHEFYCLQSPVYYYSKYLSTNDISYCLKFILETLKAYLIIEKNKTIVGYFYSNELLKYIDDIKELICFKELTACLNLLYNGFAVIKTNVSSIKHRCLEELYKLYYENKSFVQFNSVNLFFEELNAPLRDRDLFNKVRNAVFEENQGLSFEEAFYGN